MPHYSIDTTQQPNMDVTQWLLKHDARLASRRPDDFRLLQPGVYSHRTLPYGASRSGITDGIVALLATPSHGIVEVHLANLDIKLDTPPQRGGRRKQKPSERRRTTPARSSVSALLARLNNLI